jgi:hypothetical protein
VNDPDSIHGALSKLLFIEGIHWTLGKETCSFFFSVFFKIVFADALIEHTKSMGISKKIKCSTLFEMPILAFFLSYSADSLQVLEKTFKIKYFISGFYTW